MSRSLLLTASLVAAIGIGCTAPDLRECGVQCDPAGRCPQGSQCNAADGFCHSHGSAAVDCVVHDTDSGRVATDSGGAPTDGHGGDVTAFDVGAHDYTVPPGCTTIRVRLWGGGGGGGGDSGAATAGGPGGESSFGGTIHAGGGGGGADGNISPPSTFLGGAGGTATGGDINLSGMDGGNGNSQSMVLPSGAGGSSPDGGAGGASIATAQTAGASGETPGGGGSGAQGQFNPAAGGGGGAHAERQLTVSVDEVFAVVVGAGGTAGSGIYVGGIGGDGRVTVACE